jgi:hypothetical protein
MKLLGVTKLNQLGPHLVSYKKLACELTVQLNTRALDSKIIDALHYGPNEFVPSTQRK